QRCDGGGGGQPAVNRSRRNYDVVSGHGADRSVNGLEERGAVLQINSFVDDRIAVKLRGSIRGSERNLHVVISEQQLAAQYQVTAPGQVGGAHMPRDQWMIRRALFGGGAGDSLALHDRRGRMLMIEKRGIGDETFFAHQLLGVQAASRELATHIA